MEKTKLEKGKELDKLIKHKQDQVEQTKKSIEKIEEFIKDLDNPNSQSVEYTLGYSNGVWVNGIEPEMALLFNTIILSKREIELKRLEKEFEKL